MSASAALPLLAASAVSRSLAPLLCGPAGGRRLLILIYHRVLPAADPMVDEITAAQFDRQLATLARAFNVLSLPEAIDRLQGGCLPPRAIAISFDDGYADNATVALPILARHRLPASFFIATAFLDGGRMWNDTIIEAMRVAPAGVHPLLGADAEPLALNDVASRRAAALRLIRAVKPLSLAEREERLAAIARTAGAALPADLMLSCEQLRALHRAGMTIGAHTCRHPILASLPAAEAEREITDGRQRLEALIGERVTLFAYPNGVPAQDYRREHVEIVRGAGFSAALSTARGYADAGSDRFQLPRMPVWDASPLRLAARLMQYFRQSAGQVFV